MSVQQVTPGPSDEEFGRHLRQLRLALGWTLEELAGRIGLSAEDLEDVELARAEVDVTMMWGIVDGLGMNLSTILRLWERGVVMSLPSFVEDSRRA